MARPRFSSFQKCRQWTGHFNGPETHSDLDNISYCGGVLLKPFPLSLQSNWSAVKYQFPDFQIDVVLLFSLIDPHEFCHANKVVFLGDFHLDLSRKFGIFEGLVTIVDKFLKIIRLFTT